MRTPVWQWNPSRRRRTPEPEDSENIQVYDFSTSKLLVGRPSKTLVEKSAAKLRNRNNWASLDAAVPGYLPEGGHVWQYVSPDQAEHLKSLGENVVMVYVK